MEILTLRAHYEGELLPRSLLSAGFLRHGMRCYSHTPIQGLYVGVTIPWKVWREFYDWAQGRDVAAWCRYWGVFVACRGMSGRWIFKSHFMPREID